MNKVTKNALDKAQLCEVRAEAAYKLLDSYPGKKDYLVGVIQKNRELAERWKELA